MSGKISNRLSINDLNLAGKRVFIRVDFNVPLSKGPGPKTVVNTARIDAAIPTIKLALSKQPKCIVLASHLGRPKGLKNADMSLRPVYEKLEALLREQLKDKAPKVYFADDCIGEPVDKLVENAEDGSVILLENLRFHPEEEKIYSDKSKITEDMKTFADGLSKNIDVYVNDAFGTAHRAHASISGIECTQKAAGLLLAKELEFFGKAMENPERPFLSIIGGAKVTDKIQVIENLLSKVDSLLICGGMAFTFLKVMHNMEIGDSIYDAEGAKSVKDIVALAKKRNVKLVFPNDFVVTKTVKNFSEFKEPVDTKVVSQSDGIPSGFMGLDCGPQSMKAFEEIINASKMILWNGPPGVFEIKSFSKGTDEMIKLVAAKANENASVIVGGGDSGTAIANFPDKDLVSKIHVSTGGGASLELIEGRELPGITSLSSA